MSNDENADLVGENQRPEWLPENFESPEALAKSYQEAQRKITELATEKRGLEESITSLSSQFEEFVAEQKRPDPNNVLSQWQDQYEADPFGTTLSLAQTVAQQTARELLASQSQNRGPSTSPDVVAFMADRSMADHHDDWNEYKSQVGELIAQNPLFQRDELWSDPSAATSALESAYKLVKAETAVDLIQQQQADTRQMKLNAQSAAGASGRTPGVPDAQAEWDAVKAAKPKNYWE